METPYAEIRKLQQEIDQFDAIISVEKTNRKKQALVAARKKLAKKVLKLKNLELTN
ncbi:MAG: hypothetical protein AB7E34_09690 [Acidaminococcaceae bacterium]|jgi:hypothetical protein